MEQTVLVTFATMHGSTQEIAEAVAATIREQGLAVDLQPARKVRSVAGYSAIVLGAPLYMFRLHTDARAFLSKHQNALTGGLPIAIFAGGPTSESSPEDWREVRSQLDKELAKFPWLAPVAVEIVGGKHDPEKLRFPWNLLPALKQLPYIDLRDWDAIRAWAAGLPARFSGQKENRQPVLPAER